MKGNYKIRRRGRSSRKIDKLTPEQRKLIEDNLDLVKYPVYSSIINTNGNLGSYTPADLEQVAYMAICVAAHDYDKSHKKGASFRTYAQDKVKGYIRHSLRDKSRMVKINRKTYDLRKNVKELLDKGYTFSQVAEELEITENQVKLCDNSYKESWASFDYVSDNGLSLEPVYNDLDTIQCDKDLYEKIQHLSDKEIKELIDFFNDD